MEFTGSPAESHTKDAPKTKVWKGWVRTAGISVFKGICTATGAGVVSLLIWWVQNR